jgi:hypothetical protein
MVATPDLRDPLSVEFLNVNPLTVLTC